MSEFQKGDSVLVRGEVVEYIDGVGANVQLFSKTDQYRAWVRPDLLCPKGSVVLDLYNFDTQLDVCRVLEENGYGNIADQIEAQTRPPRIPEPGLWGVVEASVGGWTDGPSRFVNFGGSWIAKSPFGTKHASWSDLIDPTLIREGVESDA
jgi:hypothetical protein